MEEIGVPFAAPDHRFHRDDLMARPLVDRYTALGFPCQHHLTPLHCRILKFHCLGLSKPTGGVLQGWLRA